jgi:hypothetical protein
LADMLQSSISYFHDESMAAKKIGELEEVGEEHDGESEASAMSVLLRADDSVLDP